MPKKSLFAIVAVTVISFAGWRVFTHRQEPEQKNSSTSVSQESNSGEKSIKPGFDKSQHSVDEPGSIWWIVNKNRALPDGYVPPDLIVPDVRLRLGSGEEQMQIRELIAGGIKAMFDAAAADNVALVFGSGYRSYALQKQFYDSYVAQDGQAAADRYSARPGTSEHQAGLAVDITSTSQQCHLEICFEDLPEGQWLAAHAHEYGFIIRYLDGKESITGYQYEPWHLRFVGKKLAAELKRTGLTMEEFFSL